MKKSFLTVTDQFCGAGGSSIGAVAAGVELAMALNHWKLAIETHQTNFPNAAHDCTDISACDPRRYPSTDILITSPECTNHSVSNGKRKQTQMDLFGNGPDPAEERSRATMWDVPRFAEYHRYNAIIVENVVDARKWVNWGAWLLAMHQLGYKHQAVYFNSMYAHPTPQSRDRMYVVFWRKGNQAPNLTFTPKAWCERCGKDVAAVQAWKNGRKWGVYKEQYIYACPHCTNEVRPYYYCAANAIDWTLPCPRIGDRERPLKDKTLNRIRIGLEKYGAQAMGVELGYGQASNNRAFPLTDAMRTQTTKQTMGVCVPPFLVDTAYDGDKGRTTAIVEALRTQTARQATGVVVPPFLAKLYGMSDVEAITDPIGTQTAGGVHHALVVPYYSNGTATEVTEALPTVTTHDRHALAIPPFVLGYYTRLTGQQAAISGVDEPMPTQSTQPRHYLVRPGDVPAVEDCGFRMLQPHEIQRAMAFPDSYVVLGTKRERVKQCGNAVNPPTMEMLMNQVVETFN